MSAVLNVVEATREVTVQVPVFNVTLSLEKDQFVKLKKQAGKVGLEAYVLNTLFGAVNSESTLKNEPTPTPAPSVEVPSTPVRNRTTTSSTPTVEVPAGVSVLEVKGTNLTENEKNYLIKQGKPWSGKRMSNEQIALITARRIARATKAAENASENASTAVENPVSTLPVEVEPVVETESEVTVTPTLIDLDDTEDSSVNLSDDEEDDEDSTPDLYDTLITGDMLDGDDDPLGFDDEDDL